MRAARSYTITLYDHVNGGYVDITLVFWGENNIEVKVCEEYEKDEVPVAERCLSFHTGPRELAEALKGLLKNIAIHEQ